MSGNGGSAPQLSIVVPVLDEAPRIEGFLVALQSWRGLAEIIVVDGGSGDGSAAIAEPLCDAVLVADAGRARQMNAGAERARGDYLMFLHSDTTLTVSPPAMAGYLARGPAWGFFTARLSGDALAFRIIERMMNLRSRLTRVATGDQCLFLSRALWDSVGGFADIPLMEDVELSKRLRRKADPLLPAEPVTTSSRRWEERGIGRTMVLMWWLRLRFWLGAEPRRLAQLYRG
jgi:rSAM/selenodomain-associated transferase 2